MKTNKKEKGIWNNKPFWCILIFGLAVLCSSIKVLVLPQGGSLTYFGLLILWLMTFIYGPRYGLIASVIFGFVRLGITYLTGEYINPNIWSIILEYPMAHGLFCLGGFLSEPKKKTDLAIAENEAIQVEPYKLRMGYVIGVAAMLVCYVISAELFYPAYREGFWNNLIYNIIYDSSYLLIEGFFSVLLLCIPQVTQAIYYVKYVATHIDEDDTLECF